MCVYLPEDVLEIIIVGATLSQSVQCDVCLVMNAI